MSQAFCKLAEMAMEDVLLCAATPIDRLDFYWSRIEKFKALSFDYFLLVALLLLIKWGEIFAMENNNSNIIIIIITNAKKYPIN